MINTVKQISGIVYIGLFVGIFMLHQYSAAQFQQSQFQQTNQSQQSSFGFDSQNNSSYNQQNSGNSSRFSQSSRSSGRMSGRQTSSRSSRRNNGTDSTLNPNGAPSQVQSNRPAIPQRSLTPPNRAPGSSQNSVQSGGSDIVIHSGNSDDNKPSNSPRASVPKPRFASKAYLYLESSHLAVKVGEPFTVDVRLSGKPETKYDQLGFTLSYDPEVLMPVLDQDAAGNWLSAQSMQMLLDEDKYGATVTQNTINQQDGLIHIELTTLEPQPAKATSIARLVLVPIQKTKSTRIEFISADEDSESPLNYLRFGEEDVLGSSGDLFDGVIPLDIFIQDTGSTSKSLISSNLDKKDSKYQPATLDLVLNEHSIDVGGQVSLDIVLNNPAQLPVDEVEFLVVYNTRVLQMLSQNALASNGLEANAEKGILRYKGALRKTHAAQQTTIATIQFKALAPTTKSTFKVLVHKGGTMASTGAYYKGRDILGDPSVLTDGVRTTSIAIRPTMSYLNQSKRF